MKHHSLRIVFNLAISTSIAVALLYSGNLAAQISGAFSITGDISKVQGEKIIKVYLKSNEKGVIDDSCMVKNGKYFFKGFIEQPTLAKLFYGNLPPFVTSLSDLELMNKLQKEIFVEPRNIKIVSGTSFTKMNITGSPATNDWDRYLKIREPDDLFKATFFDKLGKLFPYLNKPYNEWTKEEIDAHEAYMQSDEAKKADVEVYESTKHVYEASIRFALQNPASQVNGSLLKGLRGYWCASIDEIASAFNNLSPVVKATPDGKFLIDYIYENQVLGIGKQAPNFSVPDSAGAMVQLTDFKGKYVFIDFWSSSCGPCRKEMPHVLEMYNKYKDKNLVVVTISTDESRERWLKAIDKDGMNSLINLCDFQPWENHPVISVAYRLSRLPANYLINPSGVIIGRYLHGDSLAEKLAEEVK